MGQQQKIELDFIQQQDLMIIGFNGWEKLISSATLMDIPSSFGLDYRDSKQALK